MKVVLSLFLCLVLTQVTFADVKSKTSARHFKEIAATDALVEQLRGGGYVVYMRHGPTDTSKPDQVPLNLKDCTKQRPLSTLGERLARAIGKQVVIAKIPVETVYASPLCRAKGTAALVFGEDNYTIDHDLMYTSHLTKAQKIPVIKRTRNLVSTPVEPGKNRFLVAHAPNMYDLMGYFPRLEGTMIVFKPLANNNYEYLGSIKPHDWLWLNDKP